MSREDSMEKKVNQLVRLYVGSGFVSTQSLAEKSAIICDTLRGFALNFGIDTLHIETAIQGYISQPLVRMPEVKDILQKAKSIRSRLGTRVGVECVKCDSTGVRSFFRRADKTMWSFKCECANGMNHLTKPRLSDPYF